MRGAEGEDHSRTIGRKDWKRKMREEEGEIGKVKELAVNKTKLGKNLNLNLKKANTKR